MVSGSLGEYAPLGEGYSWLFLVISLVCYLWKSCAKVVWCFLVAVAVAVEIAVAVVVAVAVALAVTVAVAVVVALEVVVIIY
jgi:hypothetical protein